MTWTFDESAKPPPITVNDGDSSFTLAHTYLDADARTKVMDAIATGMTSAGIGQVYDTQVLTLGLGCAFRKLAEHITGWDGVVDPAGQPVAFEHTDPKTGVVETKAIAALGMIPFQEQVRVMMIQLTMNGIEMSSHFVEIFSRLLHDMDLAKSIAEEASPFFRQPGGAVGTCSTNSATGETDTPPSDS